MSLPTDKVSNVCRKWHVELSKAAQEVKEAFKKALWT